MDETLDQSLNATSIFADQLTVMGAGAIQMLPSLVIALLVFVLTWIVACLQASVLDPVSGIFFEALPLIPVSSSR